MKALISTHPLAGNSAHAGRDGHVPHTSCVRSLATMKRVETVNRSGLRRRRALSAGTMKQKAASKLLAEGNMPFSVASIRCCETESLSEYPAEEMLYISVIYEDKKRKRVCEEKVLPADS